MIHRGMGPREQEHEVGGHIVSIGETENSECSCSNGFLLFIQSGTPVHAIVLVTIKVALPISTYSKEPLTGIPKGLSHDS